MEEFGNEKEKQHGQEKLQKRVNEENTFLQEKKHESTAFSTASSQSFSSLSVSLCHIMEPSLRHSKRKFFLTSYPVSISASLCKHLAKTKNEDHVHGFGKGVKGKKRKERENEERAREDKRCFSEKVKWSKVAKMSFVQAPYLYMLDTTGMLNMDATSLKIELGYKAGQLTLLIQRKEPYWELTGAW